MTAVATPPLITDRVITRDGLDRLVRTLVGAGFVVLGPVAHGDQVEVGPIHGVDDLPVGWGTEEDRGTAHLVRRSDAKVFGFASGAGRWSHDDVPWPAAGPHDRPLALVGVRPCELPVVTLRRRRSRLQRPADLPEVPVVVVAVDCEDPAPSCSCAVLGTGPAAGPSGWDILLTELLDPAGEQHGFLARSATAPGEALLGAVDARDARDDECRQAAALVAAAAHRVARHAPRDGIQRAPAVASLLADSLAEEG